MTQGGLRNTAFLCAYIQCFAKGEEQRLISQKPYFLFRKVQIFHFVLFRLISFRIVLPACVITCSGLLLICCFSSQGDLHCIYLARITYTSDCLNFNWCKQHCTLPKSPTPVLYNLDQQYNNPYLANTSLVSSWYFYLSVCH